VKIDKNIRIFEDFQKYGTAGHMDNRDLVLKLPEELGWGGRQEISLRPGLKLYLEDYSVKKKMTAKVEAEHYPFGISFCISGKINWRANTSNNDQVFFTRPGLYEFSFSSGSNGFVECLPDEKIIMISILMGPEPVMKLFGDKRHSLPSDFLKLVNNPVDGFSYYKDRISPFMHMAAHQMMNCRFQGAARKIYLESKTMELVALLIARLEQKSVHGLVTLKPSERERLCLVQKILADDMANPPTLAELARKAGLNETKLKKGFKHLFGTTVFGYLTDLRMERGRQLLAKGDMNVTEVSYEVGYSNRTHFTRAFTRHFGCSPVSFLQEARKHGIGEESIIV